ncbi:hypothetical protein ACNRBS_11205 [Ralstonia pseudosolanacearum]|uniref:hypothetical protein n=4 Tax=Ralstonia pseudosolanacearum TaxID=1310165 RepID=UPI001C746109|nr:hypothetical protein KN198_07960 [Ralstonia solanacearum]
MESFLMSQTATGVHIEGFPDAVKLIRLTGDKAARVADLALHRHDLDFADSCLMELSKAADSSIVQRALWHAAIVNYIKCFGGGVRTDLDADLIYGGNALAMEAYRYFRELRNKHIAHDVNAYAQCTPGAVVNKEGHQYKVAKILCTSTFAETIQQDSFDNLHNLIADARKAVEIEFDNLCAELTTELEAKPHAELLASDSVTCGVPTLQELFRQRKAAALSQPGRNARKKKR